MVFYSADLKIEIANEIKWTDEAYRNAKTTKNLVSFCHKHNLTKAICTTKTIQEEVVRSSIKIQFIPASVFAYRLGYEMLFKIRGHNTNF